MFLSWILFALLSFSFWFYTYGFLDLNLTLISNPKILTVLAKLQHLVYFQRPLSASFYLFFLLGFHLFFIWSFYSSRKFPWFWVISISLLLALTYPFLSHDLFNYLFYAKEFLLYHQNPHLVPPNHFNGDLWLRFMHWVHVPSPYGYLHTLLLLPWYILSLGKFVPNLYLLKIVNWIFYLAGLLAIAKLDSKVKSRLYFAFNPLIIFEFLVNGHNDAWMMIFLLWSLVFLFQHQSLKSLFFFLLAGGIKYITFLTLPLFLPFWFRPKLSDKLTLSNFVALLISVLAIGVILFWLLFKFQIWYLLWFVVFIPFLLTSKFQFFLSLAYSYFALLYYYFFIATGFWNREPSFYRFSLILFTLVFVFALVRQPLLNLYLWYNQKHHAS